MEVLFAAFGRFVVRFRYAIIVGWVLFGVLCVAALPSLSSVVKTQQSDFLPSNSPSLKAQRLELRFNPQGAELASLTLVAVARSGPLTLADHAAISRFEDRIQGFAHVQSVQDLGTSSDGKARQAQILAAVPTIGGGLRTRWSNRFAPHLLRRQLASNIT